MGWGRNSRKNGGKEKEIEWATHSKAQKDVGVKREKEYGKIYKKE